MHICPQVEFPFQKNFSNDVLMSLIEYTKQKYVLPLLDDYTRITSSFNLWMSKRAHDIFALVINFLGTD